MKHSRLKKSVPLLLLSSALLVACGGGGGSGDGGGSTAAIAGLWDVPEDSILGFELIEISADGLLTNFSEDTRDNCYRTFTNMLVNEGDDVYGFIGPTSDAVIISHRLVNQGDSLNFTSSFLNTDESWPAVEGVSTSDFNICS